MSAQRPSAERAGGHKLVQRLARFRRARPRLSTCAASLAALFALLLALNFALPPDLARYGDRSVEIRAANGDLLRAYLSEQGQWRLATTPGDVDPRYLRFLKDIEDKRFDTHWGVDPEAVLRAGLQWASAGHIVSGASTLTMQTARLLMPHSRGLVQKGIEALRAFELESRFSKSKILSIYLTLAPFGGNLEGVRSASLAYFGKEPEHLSVAEAALLVALPQSPERLRPDRHPEAARAGRDRVLKRLAQDGLIDAQSLAEAQKAPVPHARLAMPFDAPHLADDLFAGAKPGAIIRTPIDELRQKEIEALAAGEQHWVADGASMAAVVVENKSRDVIAYLGGANYWGPQGEVDLARALRSPGSALKPFIYGLAFDELPLHPETIMLDEPMVFGDYAPQNFDKEFQGMVSVRQALEMSLNVPAVAVLDKLGPVRLASLLENGGAHLAFPETHQLPGLPMALGGVGITLEDLAQLYVALADHGVAGDLVTDLAHRGRAGERLISARSAWYIQDILRGSPMPDGWGRGAAVARPRKVAFKTGTSYGYRDAWAVGYTPTYTVAVWVGRADGSARTDQVGRNVAAPLVFKIFDLLPAESVPDQGPPADALLVGDNADLPVTMQRFYANPQRPPETVRVRSSAPEIAFPPNGATLEIAEKSADRSIALKATGGEGPLRWIVNGALLPPVDRLGQTLWTAPGPGFVKFVVIDSTGRAAVSEVRIKFAG